MRPIVVMATTAHRWRQVNEECSREFSLALTQNLLTHTHDTHAMMKICACISTQEHKHTHTHLTTDWFTVTALIGSVLLRHKFHTQMEEKENDSSMWLCFMMFYCWYILLLWGNVCSVFDTVGWIKGKVYPSKHLSLFIFREHWGWLVRTRLFLWKSISEHLGNTFEHFHCHCQIQLQTRYN